jgi:hypothetical protein
MIEGMNFFCCFHLNTDIFAHPIIKNGWWNSANVYVKRT